MQALLPALKGSHQHLCELVANLCNLLQAHEYNKVYGDANRSLPTDAYALPYLPVFMSKFTIPAPRIRIHRSWWAPVLLLLMASRCCSAYMARGLSSAGPFLTS